MSRLGTHPIAPPATGLLEMQSPRAAEGVHDAKVSRRLIVNADDFGRSEAINRGVAEGFRRGIITSASLVAGGPAFESAVAHAAELPGLCIGVHLAVDEYRPILPVAQLPRLVNKDGRFFSRRRQYLRMVVDPRIRTDVLSEWDAQIAKLLAAGIKITHIDGHGHCHAHPMLAGVVLELGKRYGISRVRMPAEPVLWTAKSRFSRRYLGKMALWACANACRIAWKDRLDFPDRFYGFSHGGRVTPAVIRRVAEDAPECLSELMVHVGISNQEEPEFWTGYDYVGDLQAVTFYTNKEFEATYGIKLVTHSRPTDVSMGQPCRSPENSQVYSDMTIGD